MPEQTGDPNGVPRPLPVERIEKAKNNSGIMVGEIETSQQTTAGTVQDNYKTAFVKVYQDAGVIGVAMITMLVLCVILALFSARVLKMYDAVVKGQAELITSHATATEKLTTSLLMLDSHVRGSLAELKADHDDQMAKVDKVGSDMVLKATEIVSEIRRGSDKSEASFTLLSSALGRNAQERFAPFKPEGSQS